MKKTWLLIASCLALSGCQVAAGFAKPIQKSFTLGNDIYLESSVKGWSTSDTYKFVYTATDTIPYKLLNVAMAADEEFKVYCNGDWAGVNCTTDITALHFTTANASDSYANFKTVDAGTYDFYFTSNYQSSGAWKVFAIKSAQTLLEQQDLNYTRTSEIKASTDYFTSLENNNYFTCITRNRTTEFVDGGLYMHDTTGNTTNSGYYTKKNENSGNNMYHYTLAGGSDNRLVEGTRIENERLDSATNVNAFFANGHYFHDNAATIGALMAFDFDHFNYYIPNNTANAAYIQSFMYFTAPLFTNPAAAPIAFTGAGIKDLGANTMAFYLYSNDTALLAEGANTVFAQANVSAVGSTTIAFLNKYINA